jgi:TnpA family transposase
MSRLSEGMKGGQVQGHTPSSVTPRRPGRTNEYTGRRASMRRAQSPTAGFADESPFRARKHSTVAVSTTTPALARDVYCGRRGRINAQQLHEQVNSCRCPTIILACVIYWQAKEISRLVPWRQPKPRPTRTGSTSRWWSTSAGFDRGMM